MMEVLLGGLLGTFGRILEGGGGAGLFEGFFVLLRSIALTSFTCDSWVFLSLTEFVGSMWNGSGLRGFGGSSHPLLGDLENILNIYLNFPNSC